MYKSSFLILQLKDYTKKDGSAGKSVELYQNGLKTTVYLSKDNLAMFNGCVPEQRVTITFNLKNAYNSQDLQLEIVTVEQSI